jgi:hypothetical protein
MKNQSRTLLALFAGHKRWNLRRSSAPRDRFSGLWGELFQCPDEGSGRIQK